MLLFSHFDSASVSLTRLERSLLLYQTHKKGNKRPFSSVEKKGANLEYTFVRSIVSKIWKMVGVLLSSSINEVESYIPAVAVLQRVQRKRPLVPYTQIQILTAENTIMDLISILYSVDYSEIGTIS